MHCSSHLYQRSTDDPLFDLKQEMLHFRSAISGATLTILSIEENRRVKCQFLDAMSHSIA